MYSIIKIVLGVVVLQALLACSSRLGYGVILWNDASSASIANLANGQIVAIEGESKVTRSYVFRYQSEQRNISTNLVAFFRHRPNAEQYRKEFMPYHDWYAVNMNRSGLVMRSAPSNRAEQVYRLRPGQTVKVLAQATEQMQLGNISGKWYQVLTEDGIWGYVFDYYIRLEQHQSKGTKVLKLAAYEQGSDNLEVSLNSLQGSWYLKKHTQKLRSGKSIDIRLLLLAHSQLYLDRAQSRLLLYLQGQQSFAISYDEAQLRSDIPAELRFTDSGARIMFDTLNEISVYYHDGQNKETIVELQKISAEELRRYRQQAFSQRKIALNSIFSKGSLFSASELYGSIRFRANGSFLWSNTQALVEQKILSTPQHNGTMYFSYKLGISLQNIYHSIVTFAFQNGQEASFLLRLNNDMQILLRYVPAYMIDDGGAISSDAILPKIDLRMTLEGRPLIPEDL